MSQTPAPQPTLEMAVRKQLRARAHGLSPVAMVSEGGLTPGVVAEVERGLLAHELIKIRVSSDRAGRETLLDEICRRTGAMAVQHIGKVLVVYRKNPEPEKLRETRKRR